MLRNNADARRTFRFCNLRKWKDFNKKQLTSLKMCVTSLLCGSRTDLWPFCAFLCKRFSLYIRVYQTLVNLYIEQALCLGKKIARKGKGREGFPLSLVPRSTKGLFTGYLNKNGRFFFPYKSLYFECYATIPMLADAHISGLGYLWFCGI